MLTVADQKPQKSQNVILPWRLKCEKWKMRHKLIAGVENVRKVRYVWSNVCLYVSQYL